MPAPCHANSPNLACAEECIAELRREFPSFRIVKKADSSLSRSIDLFLRVITLGKQQRFMTTYHTVIGSTLYVPSSWPSTPQVDKVILLRHERVHLRQRRRLTFAGLAFLYLIPFLPLGLAYGRARLEWEAYVETLRATAELKGLASIRSAGLRGQIIERFTGPDYGWMWPFPKQVASWYDSAVAEIARSTPPKTALY